MSGEARDPRRFVPCPRCLDFGMLEDGAGNEDVCPTCEGGIWRERESWRSFIQRFRFPFGLRVSLMGRVPRVYKDWSA